MEGIHPCPVQLPQNQGEPDTLIPSEAATTARDAQSWWRWFEKDHAQNGNQGWWGIRLLQWTAIQVDETSLRQFQAWQEYADFRIEDAIQTLLFVEGRVKKCENTVNPRCILVDSWQISLSKPFPHSYVPQHEFPYLDKHIDAQPLKTSSPSFGERTS